MARPTKRMMGAMPQGGMNLGHPSASPKSPSLSLSPPTSHGLGVALGSMIYAAEARFQAQQARGNCASRLAKSKCVPITSGSEEQFRSRLLVLGLPSRIDPNMLVCISGAPKIPKFWRQTHKITPKPIPALSLEAQGNLPSNCTSKPIMNYD